MLVENKSLGQVAERNRPKVERIRTWLVRTLQAPTDASSVLRGGAFWDGAQNVRCAYRDRNDARDVFNHIGFRVALAGPP